MCQGWLTVLGFLLVVLGISSICLDVVGVQYAFLVWLNSLGKLFAFIIKLMMIIGGFMLTYLDVTGFFAKRG